MKRKLFVIAAAGIIAGAFMSANAYDGKHVNARAVSTFWINIGWEHGDVAKCGEGDMFWDGSLVLYTIRDAKVTSADTIYKRQLGNASCPVFNFSGTKIAFYRSGKAPAATGTSCVSVNGGKAHISLINPDGTGLTDLCELPNEPMSGENIPQDWPAGDWIYYEQPRTAAEAAATGSAANTPGMEIWRVNYKTLVNEKVCHLLQGGKDWKCGGIRRFTLSADASRAAIGSAGPYYGCTLDGVGSVSFQSNTLYRFPPPNCDLNGAAIQSQGACNISVSPSGTILGSYFAGWHDFMNIGLVGGGKCPLPADMPWSGTNGRCDVSIKDDLEKWTGNFIGNGAEHIRWACNSDKWILQQIGMVNDGHAASLSLGSNVVVCDFMDKVAINISNHPATYADGFTRLNNDCGDMYIEDPVNNPDNTKYEDLQGAWHVVPDATPVAYQTSAGDRDAALGGTAFIQSITAGAIRIHVAQKTSWAITIAGVDGRTVRSLTGAGAGDIAVPAAGITRGTFLITLTEGGKHFVNRCVVR
jgi:hypothetical protein